MSTWFTHELGPKRLRVQHLAVAGAFPAVVEMVLMTSDVTDSYQLWCLSRLVRNKMVHVLNENRASVQLHETISPVYAHLVQLDAEDGPADEQEEQMAQEMLRWLLTG